MKKLLTVAAAAAIALGAWAEDIKTMVVVPTPAMSCQNCEKRIKSNIRFVKGTKSIETSLGDNTVTIKYDADKATLADYEEAFRKIGREIEVLPEPAQEPAQDKR